MTARETAQAFWTVSPGNGEIRTEYLPALGPEEVLVEALWSGVSRGTERLVFEGRVPLNQAQLMRAPFQVGEFPGPVKYGYASVGRVLAGPPPLLGQHVFCLFPHQSRYVVPTHAVLQLPPDVPTQRAVLAANMETALNAVWDAGPLPGDRVTVVGAGALGCLLGNLLTRSLALEVQTVDVDNSRRPYVERTSGNFRVPQDAADGRDIVFHTSATEDGLNTCLRLARRGGRVVELSWYGSRAVSVTLGEGFHSGRLQLISSQVGTVSPNKGGWSHRQRLGLALELLTDARLDALLEVVPFADLPTYFLNASGRETAPCLCVAYPAAPAP